MGSRSRRVTGGVESKGSSRSAGRAAELGKQAAEEIYYTRLGLTWHKLSAAAHDRKLRTGNDPGTASGHLSCAPSPSLPRTGKRWPTTGTITPIPASNARWRSSGSRATTSPTTGVLSNLVDDGFSGGGLLLLHTVAEDHSLDPLGKELRAVQGPPPRRG